MTKLGEVILKKPDSQEPPKMFTFDNVFDKEYSFIIFFFELKTNSKFVVLCKKIFIMKQLILL